MGLQLLGTVAAGCLASLTTPVAPAYASMRTECCDDVTAAYVLVFTDHCAGDITVSVANPSSQTGSVAINNGPMIDLPRNTTVTRDVKPLRGGLVNVDIAFGGRPDQISHRWAAADCAKPKSALVPTSSRTATGHPTPARSSARATATPSSPALAAPRPPTATATPTPAPQSGSGNERITIWTTVGSQAFRVPAALASSVALLALGATALFMLFPRRRPPARHRARRRPAA